MTHGRADIEALLDAWSLRPSRALGQNFVADANTVRRIVRLAGVGPGDPVVEVGAGLGSLTLALVEAGAAVTAVEVDRHLVPVLRSELAGRAVRIVEADALRLDWGALLVGDAGDPGDGRDPGDHGDHGDHGEERSAGDPGHPAEERSAGEPGGGGIRPWSLVANLPYNVATPLVVRVLEEAPQVGTLLVMVQREVGERLAAGVGDAAYGAVSVKVAYWGRASVVGRVPATVFVPRPRVESVLVRIERRPAPVVASSPGAVAYAQVFDLVRAGFAQRRKMLRRSLEGRAGVDAFDAAGIRPTARAEELALEEWIRLAAAARGSM